MDDFFSFLPIYLITKFVIVVFAGIVIYWDSLICELIEIFDFCIQKPIFQRKNRTWKWICTKWKRWLDVEICFNSQTVSRSPAKSGSTWIIKDIIMIWLIHFVLSFQCSQWSPIIYEKSAKFWNYNEKNVSKSRNCF